MFRVSLVRQTGSKKGTRYQIRDERVVIGRSKHCEVIISDHRASRKHAQLWMNGVEVKVKDLGSRNGTLVNNQLISSDEPTRLFHNDELRIGKDRFRLSIRDPETNQPQLRPKEGTLATSPPLPDLEPVEDLFGELDDLVTQSRMGNTKIDDTKSFEELRNILNRQKKREKRNEDSSRIQAKPSGKIEQTDSTNQQQPASSSSQPAGEGEPSDQDRDTAETDASNIDAIEDDLLDSGERGDLAKLASRSSIEPEEDKGPKGLPEHLKKKGTADSQAAARAALKNLFGN